MDGSRNQGGRKSGSAGVVDKAQFIEMVSREQESLRRFLCVLCRGDAFRADDIAQEALLKAYLSFGKFEGRAKFSTWLFRIAYNCFYDNIAASKKTEGEPLTVGPCADSNIRNFTGPSETFLKKSRPSFFFSIWRKSLSRR